MKRRALVFLVVFGGLAASAAIVDYPWPSAAPISSLYQVRMWQGGVTNTMYTHYSEPNLTPGEDGDGVTGVLDNRSMSFVQYAFTGEIDVEVTKLYGTTAPRVEIQPKAYGINPYFFDGRTVRFKLSNVDDRTEYISVNFVSADNQDDDGSGGKDIKNGLMLFGDAPETDVPNTNAAGVVVYSPSVSEAALASADLIYFPPGVHDLQARYPANPRMSSMPIGKHGQEVYAAGGAFIKGAIHANGKDDLRIYGRGIFTGQHLWWHAIRDESGTKDGFMEFMGSDDGRYEGVIVENPTHHTWPSAKRNTYRNVKVIGWASNHDGLRPGGGSLIDAVFLKTSDDLDYARDLHTGQNSVIWPMRNGAFGQLGWNNLGTGYTTYTNLYFINPEWHSYNRNRGVIGSVLNQGVNQESNVLENIYCENNLSLLANVTIEYDGGTAWDPGNPGEIKDFTFRNIIIESFTAANGGIVKNPIHGFERNGVKAMIRDFKFINIVAGNQLVTAANASTWFDIDPNTTSNISFTTEGNIHTVTATAIGSGTLSPSGALPTPEGMARSVAIIPNPGNRIKTVTVDGVDQGRLQNVTFADVAANHTVVAEFEPGDDYFDLGGGTPPEPPPPGDLLVYEPFSHGTGLGEGDSFIGVLTGAINLQPWDSSADANGTDENKKYEAFAAPYTDGTFTLQTEGSAGLLVGDQGPFSAALSSPVSFSDGDTAYVAYMASLEDSDRQQSWLGLPFDADTLEIRFHQTGASGAVDNGMFAVVFNNNAVTAGGFDNNPLNQDDLYVVRIDFYEAGDEQVYVFKNPNLTEVPTPGSAISSYSIELGSTLSALELNSNGALPDLNIDEIRVGTSYAAVVPTGLSPYGMWATLYGLAEEESGDDDNDGLSNLYEYGLGGNPTNALNLGILPIFGNAGSGFDYIYVKRANDPDLVYYLETSTNLVSNVWTNAGYSVVGTNVTGGTFDIITNTIPAGESQTFIRLIIENSP
ncbi:Dextranase [Pontiella desulfatans]|uniref:Dextranase n=1 Tax=Pontiella desulfatans TaxID=2750659 RepID=A0A6C2U054_PONDE|nr:hypothetical protein [Pontiella desulfatans]VGO13330.1 Dextranase [Pontiella desulfatans]